MVRKTIVFFVSLIVLYFLIQIGSGYLLTLLYTPDLASGLPSSHLPSQVAFGSASFSLNGYALLISLVLSFLISWVWKVKA